MKKRIFIKIYGRVVGVGFRYTTRKLASQLGLAGYVKNCPDGTVEIEAEAEEDDLRELLDWARKGPGYAKVERIEYKWGENRDEFEKFNIEY